MSALLANLTEQHQDFFLLMIQTWTAMFSVLNIHDLTSAQNCKCSEKELGRKSYDNICIFNEQMLYLLAQWNYHVFLTQFRQKNMNKWLKEPSKKKNGNIVLKIQCFRFVFQVHTN
jgi:hypothetical protein